MQSWRLRRIIALESNESSVAKWHLCLKRLENMKKRQAAKMALRRRKQHMPAAAIIAQWRSGGDAQMKLS